MACFFPHFSANPSLFIFFPNNRDVDGFIDSLENTIDFFAGAEAAAEGKEDDFVPFI